MMIINDLQWDVGYTASLDTAPNKRVPAIVPGAVQLDWAKAHGWGDYFYADNWKEYLWMEDVYWSYTAYFTKPALDSKDKVYFVCKGVDYQFIVKLNGEVVHQQEGMFTPFEIDITGKISGSNELEIIIYPAPKRKGAAIGREQTDQCCKPAVSYGWDWHPRLIPLGIWDVAYIEIRQNAYISDAQISYSLTEELSMVHVDLDVAVSKIGDKQLITVDMDLDVTIHESNDEELSKVYADLDNIALESGNMQLRWQLIGKYNTVVVDKIADAGSKQIRLSDELKNPELWWPNEQGEPNLYTSRVDLLSSNGDILDTKEMRVGFRRVQLVMHRGAWESPSEFPRSRSNPPITLEINGRQIFCKGSNWVNPEIFPGIINADTYRPLLQLAKDAHMNLLRVWGGGIVNKDCFYEQCDELGIMVWQEFPLACNNYVGSDKYLKILDQESRSIISRLRCHPSLAIWCGGNELFNSWSGMTDQSKALRLLNRNCYDLDPERPFLMTSPLTGMAHGNYIFKYMSGEEVFQAMPKAQNTAYTEFGCPGPSAVEYLKTFIPENELFPPLPGTVWESHHAFGAWDQKPSTWLTLDIIEEYFGASDTLEKLVDRGQMLQCEGYKCIFEEARRQKPRCSMALNWCYNEPWPTAANNSLVNWPSKPKPAYYAVKQSCRPVLASARIPKFSWKVGEVFNPELWILNDMPRSLNKGRVEAYLKIGTEEFHLTTWNYPQLTESTNERGPEIQFVLPFVEAECMYLVLRDSEFNEMDSEYKLLYSSK